MTKLPEFVYLVTVDNEWPVSAIAGDHPSVIDWVAAEVKRREASANAAYPQMVHVWRVPVADAVEVEISQPAVVPASMKVRVPEAGQ